MINLRYRQTGTFSVEFALLGVVFATLLILTGDVIIKLSIQGKLDRLSYSLVNVLKERTQLYGKNDNTLTTDDAKALYKVARNSLERTTGNYSQANLSGTFEMLSFDLNGNSNTTTVKRGGGCTLTETIQGLQALSMMTSWGRRATLYRVTLCYETDNWAGELFETDFTTVQSSSVMMGR
ncbi:tight adherence pilus pseudopilin TadF [Vibrio splendidus]|uniref:tight adherence pilus pseudopilin TadF n=1 Tax=Vibrio splendidus TaxID=29497 RepID=UPI000C85DC27|nr:tight adherence pilus pseudopilin TadF [Vibrio splendidus]